jgi:hypothetical protein
MLEYVFFSDEPRRRFVEFLSEKGIEAALDEREIERVIMVPEEEVTDVLADEIEAFYDEMFELDQQLYEENVPDSPESYHASGVVVNLKDGRAVYADVRPALLRKVMQGISPMELGELVDAIVQAVEDPDERTFCQRMRGDSRE